MYVCMYAYIRYGDSASTWLRNESLLFQLQRAKAAGRSDFVNAWPKTFSASPVGLQSVFMSVMRGFGRSENRCGSSFAAPCVGSRDDHGVFRIFRCCSNR